MKKFWDFFVQKVRKGLYLQHFSDFKTVPGGNQMKKNS